MLKANFSRVKAAFSGLSPVGKLIVFVVAFIIGALLVAVSGSIGHRIASARYQKKEAETMKKVQTALAAAEAATKRAEAAEAKAELLEQQNAAKAKTLDAKTQQIIEEGKKTDEKLSEELRADTARISGVYSAFERCTDICSRLDRLAAANPNLAAYRCAADSCDEADRTPDTNQ
jgi:biopolymer transport protein ExbB/TolQ